MSELESEWVYPSEVVGEIDPPDKGYRAYIADEVDALVERQVMPQEVRNALLKILESSAIKGIFIHSGPILANWLEDTETGDSILKDSTQ